MSHKEIVMVPMTALWLPIVRADYKKLPRETERLAGLRGDDLTPGLYNFPWCDSMKETGSAEMLEKYRQGPVGMLIAFPNRPMALGKYLGSWFVFLLVVSFFVAYIAGHTLGAGHVYLEVFRVAGAVAFMTYGLGGVVNSIWFGIPWSNSIRGMIDGLIYALVTAGTFGWLWPR